MMIESHFGTYSTNRNRLYLGKFTKEHLEQTAPGFKAASLESGLTEHFEKHLVKRRVLLALGSIVPAFGLILVSGLKGLDSTAGAPYFLGAFGSLVAGILADGTSENAAKRNAERDVNRDFAAFRASEDSEGSRLLRPQIFPLTHFH